MTTGAHLGERRLSGEDDGDCDGGGCGDVDGGGCVGGGFVVVLMEMILCEEKFGFRIPK